MPDELQIRVRVRSADDQTPNALAETWSFVVGSAWAYEFLIDDVLVGERDSRNQWLPRYSSWSARG